MLRGLILDLDNTLYNWVDSFAPSFRAMVHVLARVTQLDEITITESFSRVYEKYQTVEYSFAIQELDLWGELGWSQERIMTEAVNPARVAFGRVRKKHLFLYPGVKETLEWIHRQDMVIIAYSAAPIFLAEWRLKNLHIDHYFTCLYSWYGYSLPTELEIPQQVADRIRKGGYKSRIRFKRAFDFDTMKPNPTGLIQILHENKLDMKKTYLMGDSLDKDIVVAQTVGIIDIWAKYGVDVLEESLETISRIKQWDQNYNKKNRLEISPSHIADKFSDLKKIIQPTQLSLFG